MTIAEEPGEDTGGRSDVTGIYFVVEPDGGQLRELASRIDDRTLHPVVSATFGLSDLAAAFGTGRDRRGPGKVVISAAPIPRPAADRSGPGQRGRG